jgi:hypothetical protein
MFDLRGLDDRVQDSVETFWASRTAQGAKQGAVSGVRDAGSRVNVTGGKHLDAFVRHLQELIVEHCPAIQVHTQSTVLPGYFRATKQWDLVLLHGEKLVGCVELKSQVGSFGNNINNRTEEAVGSAADIQTAYREGAFAPSSKPWVGYLMLLEEAAKSLAPVRNQEPHFKVFPEFDGASYAKRYELGITKLVREGLYESGCFLLTKKGPPVSWREPNEELTFKQFAASLLGHAASIAAIES